MQARPILLSFLAACVWAAGSANAAVLVYEGFNYGIAGGATINGVTTTGTGLTGTYSVANTNTASQTYSSTGLSFGPNFLPGSGGGLAVSATGSSSAAGLTFSGVSLNAGTVTGDLWSSYLVNFSELGTSDGAVTIQRLNTGKTAGGGTGRLQSAAEASNGVIRKPGVGYNSTVVNYTGSFTLQTATTYLVLSKFTNVGTSLSGSNPGVASLWLFTQSGYDDWIGNGATEGSLSSFASATASSSVTSGTFNFDNSNFVQFAAYGGATASTPQTALMDELRYGTTLQDVAAIPEPGSMSLLAAALAGMLIRRRRLHGTKLER